MIIALSLTCMALCIIVIMLEKRIIKLENKIR